MLFQIYFFENLLLRVLLFFYRAYTIHNEDSSKPSLGERILSHRKSWLGPGENRIVFFLLCRRRRCRHSKDRTRCKRTATAGHLSYSLSLRAAVSRSFMILRSINKIHPLALLFSSPLPASPYCFLTIRTTRLAFLHPVLLKKKILRQFSVVNRLFSWAAEKIKIRQLWPWLNGLTTRTDR